MRNDKTASASIIKFRYVSLKVPVLIPQKTYGKWSCHGFSRGTCGKPGQEAVRAEFSAAADNRPDQLLPEISFSWYGKMKTDKDNMPFCFVTSKWFFALPGPDLGNSEEINSCNISLSFMSSASEPRSSTSHGGASWVSISSSTEKVMNGESKQTTWGWNKIYGQH